MSTHKITLTFTIETDNEEDPIGPAALANGIANGLPSEWFTADDGDDFYISKISWDETPSKVYAPRGPRCPLHGTTLDEEGWCQVMVGGDRHQVRL